MLKSDLLVLNEDLWMREEKHVILKAVSMKDKDDECANTQHRSCSAMGKQHGLSPGGCLCLCTTTHWSPHSYVQQEQAQPLTQQNKARLHSLI